MNGVVSRGERCAGSLEGVAVRGREVMLEMSVGKVKDLLLLLVETGDAVHDEIG